MGPAAKPRKTTKKKGSVSKQSLKETATKSDYDRLATTIIRSKTSKSTKNTTIKIVPQLHLPKISVQIDADQMGIYCINKKLKIITCGRHVKSTLPPPVFDILQQPMNSAVSGDLLFDGSRYFVRVHGTSRSAFFDAIQSVLAHRKYILKIPLTQQEHFYFLSNGSKRFDPGQFDDVLGPNQHLTSYVVTGKCAKAYTDDIEMRTHTTKTGVTKAYPKTKRGERGNADMYSQIINTEKISYATIEKARLRQRLKKLKTIDASKKRPCRILSSSSDSSHSSTDNSTDEDVENSTEHGETEEDESQQGTASEGTSSTIESPETSPQQIFSPGPPPDDPPPYIEKKMRLKNRQISPPKETSPTCDLEPIIPTLLPSTIVDSPGKSIPSNPGTTSALGNPLLPLCRPRDELSPTALTFMPFQINDVPASITGISGSMLERIDALRDYMSFLNTYLAQIENKEELSPINTSNTIIRSAHEYVSWLQRMAHYFNIPSLPEGLVAKVVQLNESISSCGTDEPPFVPFGTLINFVQAIMTNGGRLRTAIYEALKKQYCTPPRKVKMVSYHEMDLSRIAFFFKFV
ncbi:unnamed protein product [Bemisia tabaci]|uniref:Uncharacterized protein n=1 Tax=Bemisia tabaci TaxID=7038 RepID=A0A9P0AMB6_BEMTA|nr:unnamed protein product [Bemisia tabaci]